MSVPLTRRQEAGEEIEVPEEPWEDGDDDRRLWVGNLGTDITEYSMLKLMQTFGRLQKMNFIYHKSGPNKGKPRGYCFVTFHTWEAAEKARQTLDGKVVLLRKLYVKWAHRMRQDDLVVSKPKLKSAAPTSSLAPSDASPSPLIAAALSASSSIAEASTDAKIKAIEAKLKAMEQTQKDFSLGTNIRPPLPPSLPLHKQGAHFIRQTPYKESQRPKRKQ